MKSIFSIIIFIPIFCFGQLNTKYYTKKQEVKGLQSYIDSLNIILGSEIESLVEKKKTNQAELEKLLLKQSKFKLALSHTKKAKRRLNSGNIVSLATASLAFISFQIANKPSTGFIDFSEIYLASAGILVFIGQAINIPLKISAKEKIRKAKGIIKEINCLH